MRVKKCVRIKAVTGDVWHASISLLIQLIIISIMAIGASLLCLENLPDPCNTLDRQWLAKRPLRSDTIPLLICGLDYDHNHFNCISGSPAHVPWRLLPDKVAWSLSTKDPDFQQMMILLDKMEESGKDSLFYSSRSPLSKVMDGQNDHLDCPCFCGQSVMQRQLMEGDNSSSLLNTNCKSSLLNFGVFCFPLGLTGGMWL